MKLSEICRLIPDCQMFGDDVDITSIAYDSRQVTPGSLFVALRGRNSDGHDFIPEATFKGAVALMVMSDQAGWFGTRGLPALAAPNTRQALPYAAAGFYGDPSLSLTLVGVTGTNGKTTTTHMIDSIFRTLGERTGLIGTLGTVINGRAISTERTTPESVDLQRFFAEMRDSDVRYATMEVASEGILQERTTRCAFDVGVFTNLTQDHLNTHGTMEAYFAQKMRLFDEYPRAMSEKTFTGVVNVDDPWSERVIRILEDAGRAVMKFSSRPDAAQVSATVEEVRPNGTRFTIRYQPPIGSAVRIPVDLRMGGLFQVSNALAAASVAILCRVPAQAIRNGLEALSGVPGRFELVDTGARGFHVVVDYAHSPDGLENVLRSARALNPKRLICVFGCGGVRDKLKRPIMGRISRELADLTVITSDNPRTENPEEIVAEILAGIENASTDPSVVVDVDRHAAIRTALCELSRPGDLIVIAGKGHETVQQLADHTIPFDDRQVAREVLAQCS